MYCHEQTSGPYTRYCGSDSAVSCSIRYGGGKILRLFPEVVDILDCFEQVKAGISRTLKHPTALPQAYADSTASKVDLRDHVCR